MSLYTGNAPDFYTEGNQFEALLGHSQPWLFLQLSVRFP
jgi:hypothetical protein